MTTTKTISEKDNKYINCTNGVIDG